MLGSRMLGRPIFIASFLGCLVLSTATVSAQKRLSEQAAETLLQSGDRLADQGDYLEAVRNYTEAYLGIVAKLRQQEFSKDVTPSLMTREELAEEMKRQVKEEYTDAEWKLIQGTYRAFGLIPNTIDVKETMTKLLTEEVGGFYDPKTKAMVLVREADKKRQPGTLGRLLGQKPTFDKEEQKITLAHELTHALQDQLYGLLDKQRSIEHDDDMSMAFSALVEGDATLIMFGEMGRQEGDSTTWTQMDPDAAKLMFNMMKMMLPVAAGKTYRAAPAIFRDSLLFPYSQGFVFNLNLTRKGGIDRIHQAYATPPVSTEQILHPKKYLEDRDDPVTITITSPENLLDSQWKHLGGNCLGEFQISILFRRTPNGTQASEGWDGDRYEIYEDRDGNLALIWCSIWDSADDAKQFETAWNRYAELREIQDKTTIERNESRVRVVQGISQEIARSVLEKLRCVESPKVFPASKPNP